jgi:hypothetical protein
LGGTLDLSAPPAIGGTTANTVRGTTITATSSFVGSYFDASGSGGGALRSNTGTSCLQWGGGGGGNLTVDVSANLNGANAALSLSPTGTGTVAISPAGALTVNPTTASTMNNVAIGGTTPLAGTFTTLRVNSTISLAGSTGTSGYVLTSAGASAPTWSALPASGITITDDTTTNATRYLAFTSATSGSITGQNVASTKLQFNPSTGTLTATALSGTLAGSNVSGNISGNAANVTGTVAVANGGTGATSLTANNVLLGNGTSALQVVAPSTNGNVLTSNGTTWTSSAPAAYPLTSGTAVASTSGTSIDFTSIPSWVKRITVMFNSVSTSGTSNYLVQIGSGSVTTSGYTGQANSGAGISGNSIGFIVCNNIGSASTHAGAATILAFGSNTYIETGLVGSTGSAASMSTSEGVVTLAGVLDRVRITTVNGTDTFDAGSINILYE